MLIVQKYGGSSVADKEKIFNAAKRISETYEAGNKVVVVVSAQGDTTDDLILAADNINPDASMREMDMLLSTGEQQSASLMAMALKLIGYEAVSLNAWQAGICTSNEYGSARIKSIDGTRILKELDNNNIVIVAGFQGINEFGDITTLGRGGSDTTAVALSVALNADKCEIYTDVEGVFTADPRVAQNAIKLDKINYDEMLEYTTMGASVLHNRSVELAKNKEINVAVRSSFSNESGTEVKHAIENSANVISGIAADNEAVLVTISGKNIKSLSDIVENGVAVDMVEFGENTRFTVAVGSVKMITKSIGREGIHYEKCAKISVIGTGIQSSPKVLASIIRVLGAEGIEVKMLLSTEIRISIIIDRNDSGRAVCALHKELIEKKL